MIIDSVLGKMRFGNSIGRKKISSILLAANLLPPIAIKRIFFLKRQKNAKTLTNRYSMACF